MISQQATKTILTIIFLASLVSATCQTGYDYCANITYTIPSSFVSGIGQWTYLDLSSMEAGYATPLGGTPSWVCNSNRICLNIEGEPYVPLSTGPPVGVYHGNKTWVLVNITKPATYGLTGPSIDGPYLATSSHTFQDDKIILNITINDPAKRKIYINICLNGTFLKDYPRNENATTQSIIINESDFTAYYRRNWTFRIDNYTYANFTGSSAFLNVYCPNRGAFQYNLSTLPYSGSITVQTLEQPTFLANWLGVIRSRSDTQHFLKDDYFVNISMQQYQYTLKDATGQCNGPFVVRKSIGDTLDIIDSSFFDMQRNTFIFLDNSTAYDTIIYCKDGSYRDYGTFIQGNTYQRNVEVDNLPLVPPNNPYSGGFVPQILGSTSTGIIGLLYQKTSGSVDINFTVQDITTIPATEVYNDYQSGLTTGGQITYQVTNPNHTYYASLHAVNDGQSIDKGDFFYSANITAAYPDFPDEVDGLDTEWIYKGFAILGVVALLLSAAAIDSGYLVVAALAWTLLFSFMPRLDGTLGWVYLPTWAQILICMIGLPLLWWLSRRHDE